MAIPTDPLLSSQWHLIQNVGGRFDLNVSGAWNYGYTGSGIDVFVIDDAFDYTHSDLSPNYNTSRDFDYADNDSDPFGASSEAHGTAVMGIIGADNNGTGAVGIAFDSEVVGYRLYGFISDRWLGNVRDSVRDAANNGADVVNISQGMANAASTVMGGVLNQSLVNAIRSSNDHAVDSGRGGLGTIITKSAGNSRGTNYDVNADMWTNDTRQVVVAAVDQDGTVSSYSSYGAANLVSGFGTPGQVVTTDRVGSAGYSSGDFTSTFNGTSSAAPMVAGVVSLILDANEDLGWRDVQNILSYSARHVGSVINGSATDGIEREPWEWNGADNWNGGGLHFSNDYGFGLVDATAAVRLAETWHVGTSAQTSANESSTFEDGLNRSETIDGIVNGGVTGNTVGSETFNITESSSILVERVSLTVTFQTTYISDVEVYLISPDGTESELLRDIVSNQSQRANDFNGTWTFESQEFRGELSNGTWRVRIVDDASGDQLIVSDLDLRTFGTSARSNDRYVFTDEFSNYAGTAGHSTTLSDTDGGTDTVNTAAISSNTTIRLGNGQASSIDGVSVTTSGNTIENAVTGDGNDVLIGNSLANELRGGRGADYMAGAAGNDVYRVDNAGDNVFENSGQGTDLVVSTVSFSLQSDLHVENLILRGTANMTGTGNDRWNVLTGHQGNDTLNGLAGNDTLRGGNGNDTHDGGRGADLMEGGRGNDIYHVDNAGDRINESASQGTDLVISTRSFNLSSHSINLENLILRGTASMTATGNDRWNVLTGHHGNDNLRGLAGNDTLRGGNGNDTHDGGRGADLMEGGRGNDVYHVDNAGDRINESSGQGTDLVVSTRSFDLSSQSINLENLILRGTANMTGTGNDRWNVLTGHQGNDTLNGLAGNDTLRGGNGNDTHNGGRGADLMEGGRGNDIYHVDNAGDRVNESSGQGTDLVIATRSFDLSAHSLHLENLILRGTANMTGTGNDRWNEITGHHGNDTLNGLAGNDTLRGGNGNDTLNGGRGNDFMDGGRNSDRLDGGSGSDTYIGGSGNDTFVFRNSGGTNTVRDYQDGDDMFEVGLSVGSFSNVTVADSGANTILTFGGTTVVLENVDHNLIGSDDFNFV